MFSKEWNEVKGCLILWGLYISSDFIKIKVIKVLKNPNTNVKIVI